ncbi:MAG: tripartite tricarboxylate transporter substrate binding protein [Thalassobaculales bacterium]
MKKLSRRKFMAASAAAATLPLAAPAIAQANYPNRPITMVCPWGAGGGTDATARIVSALLEKELGQPVNVVNRTGGNGVVGHSAIATAAPDGYTLGMITVETNMMHWQGLTDLKYSSFTPLALMNADPPGVQVGTNSPFKNVKEIIEFVRANPGKLKASGTGQGGIWHLALAGWLQAMNIKPDAVPWVPSNGAAPAMQDLAAGGVDIVTCSVPEARAMIEAGKAKSLAVMSPQRNSAFPNVPTLKEELGTDWTLAAWRGIAGPRNLPKAVVDRMVPALKKIYDSKDFQEFMSARGFGVVYADPAGFEKFMADDNAKMGSVMKAVGLAKA